MPVHTSTIHDVSPYSAAVGPAQFTPTTNISRGQDWHQVKANLGSVPKSIAMRAMLCTSPIVNKDGDGQGQKCSRTRMMALRTASHQHNHTNNAVIYFLAQAILMRDILCWTHQKYGWRR